MDNETVTVRCPDCRSDRTMKVLSTRTSTLYVCRDCLKSFEVSITAKKTA